MFESLRNGINSVFNKLRGTTRIGEKELDQILEDLKRSLYEADVHYDVVNQFLKQVKEQALGQEVHKALSPTQQILKIVHASLTSLLGENQAPITLKEAPAVIMLVGLQGAGKTTTSVKLARNIKSKMGRNPLLLGVDFNRPAAVEQLNILSQNNGLPVFQASQGGLFKTTPRSAVKEAIKYAEKNNHDTIIIDTAGRLHIDTDLMNELKELKALTSPSEILLVADSMMGQDAVNVAKEFDSLLDLSGFILTKMDSDTRGGSALSLYYTTRKPVKFIATGEKIDEFEAFYPDRVASRILDLGDLLSLVEKAQDTFDQKEAEKLEKKIRSNEFTLDDFLSQMKQIKKLGSIESIMSMIPGLGGLSSKLKGMAPPEQELKKIEAMINSMTTKERRQPAIINGSRRKRIAMGSGTSIPDLNKFLKQFENMKKMMKHLPKGRIPDLGLLRNSGL
jgi:signal recognition particle subunit SRP54